MDRILITIFTDPMMGLSYECQPIFDRLKKAYGDKIEIKHIMAGLVRDVSDFMTPEELSYEYEEGIRRYCRRLAGIYKSEESIGGLPINMEGFQLFDAEHRSSYPLCIAYEAAKMTNQDKADGYLFRLREATIVETRQTTREDELVRVAAETGLDETIFREYLNGGAAEKVFIKDLEYSRSLGIRGLPAYLIQTGERRMLVQSLIGYDEFIRIFGILSK